jgi:hypothetical protein
MVARRFSYVTQPNYSELNTFGSLPNEFRFIPKPNVNEQSSDDNIVKTNQNKFTPTLSNVAGDKVIDTSLENVPQKYGALSDITLPEYQTFKEGFLARGKSAQMQPFKTFEGKLPSAITDFSFNRMTPVSAFLPAPFGALINAGQLMSTARTEQLAQKMFGKDMSLIEAGKISAKDSKTNALMNVIENQYANQGGATRANVQDYFMKNLPSLDLAPVAFKGYKDSGTFRDVEPIQTTYRTTQPFKTGSILRTSGFTGDYGKEAQDIDESGQRFGLGKTYEQAILSGDYDDQLKSVDQFAGDNINQSNIIGAVDREGNKIYDPAFARAVTIEKQKESGSYDADPTYICTALYEMGDMKKYIYKYDEKYGSQVNPAIYRGYATWGKFIANKMRNKGLLYKVIKPIALAWAYQMAYDLSKGKVGKKNIIIKLAKGLGEGICFILGHTLKRS